ncbi:MAG: F0F1 ATP synthase subunit A, partial [Holophagales bacterium]|nr:F0F1 ATP synthase subunit A [Holophagales bacterium]
MRFQTAGGDPLQHVLPHPILQKPIDLGNDLLNTVFAQDGVITLLSDQIVILIVGTLLLVLVFPSLARKTQGSSGLAALVPKGFGSFVEMVCEYWRKDVAEVHLGEHTDRFIHYIWSAFFFVLTMNLLGLIPFAAVTPSLLGIYIGGTPTGNIFLTATLAVLTLILMVWNGLRIGGKHYLAHFVPGPWWMKPLMLVVEVIGLIAKIFALAVRLFANMVAGHVLLAVLLSMILMAGSALGPVIGLGIAIPLVLGGIAVTMLEIFVSFLQAFIFTYLTVLF